MSMRLVTEPVITRGLDLGAGVAVLQGQVVTPAAGGAVLADGGADGTNFASIYWVLTGTDRPDVAESGSVGVVGGPFVADFDLDAFEAAVATYAVGDQLVISTPAVGPPVLVAGRMREAAGGEVDSFAVIGFVERVADAGGFVRVRVR